MNSIFLLPVRTMCCSWNAYTSPFRNLNWGMKPTRHSPRDSRLWTSLNNLITGEMETELLAEPSGQTELPTESWKRAQEEEKMWEREKERWNSKEKTRNWHKTPCFSCSCRALEEGSNRVVNHCKWWKAYKYCGLWKEQFVALQAADESLHWATPQ